LEWPADTLSKSFIELGLLPIKFLPYGAVELGLVTVIQCAEIMFTMCVCAHQYVDDVDDTVDNVVVVTPPRPGASPTPSGP